MRKKIKKVIKKMAERSVLKKGRREQLKNIDRVAERKAKKRVGNLGRRAGVQLKTKIKKDIIKRQKKKGIL